MEYQIPKTSKTKSRNALLLFCLITCLALILVSLTYEVHHATSSSEKRTVQLPDGSTVMLNAKSSLSHKRFFWNSDKRVDIQGEGYFITKKESRVPLLVFTDKGNIIGNNSRFNVKSRSKTFELTCYDGTALFENSSKKKRVHITDQEYLKLKGLAIHKNSTDTSEPSWINGVSSFDGVVLSEVLSELRVQYGIDFICLEEIDTSRKFTGHFPHNDLELSLNVVFIPMGIDYLYEKNNRTISLCSNG